MLAGFEDKPSVVVEHSGGQGVTAGEDRGARGVAERILAIGEVEANALGCETVDVRGTCDRVAIASDAAIEVIDGDEEDVGPGLLRGE